MIAIHNCVFLCGGVMTNPIFKVLFLSLFVFLPISACKAEEVQTLQSLPFLAVDLNGNGKIDTIPLEESEVYFDVDGDGLAERTEWISADDGFISIFSKEDSVHNARNQTNIERLYSLLVNGPLKVRKFDNNRDDFYDEEDFIVHQHSSGQIIDNLSFVIVQDKDQNGVPEGQRSNIVKCDLEFFHLRASSQMHKLKCRDKEYNAYEVNMEYEDTNIVWEAVCGSLSYGGAWFNENSISQFQCLEQGFVPEDPWSKNVWEEYKKGNNND